MAKKNRYSTGTPPTNISARRPATPGSSQPSINLPPVLLPKLQIPRLHTYLVARERLHALLDRGFARKLILISAPAGFGKTTLVCQWLAARRSQDHPLRLAWLSLDAGDNDPVRFWQYLMLACRSLDGAAGSLSVPAPQAASFGVQSWHANMVQPFSETLLVPFLNTMSKIRDPSFLVLEDYHLIASERIHEVVATLIEHFPPTLHVILITRSDPPLQLSRLRAQDHVVELDSSDLGFSYDETLDFLQHALPFSLLEEDVRRFEARTEGWGAGLRLLALALQRKKDRLDVASFLDTFSGTHRHFLEYFVTEVLQAQPEPVQEFLMQTSVLARLTGPLCDAITGLENSAHLLEELEQAGLFLVPLDDSGEWYRYHALFAEAVEHEARNRLGEEKLTHSYRRASFWYEENGLLPEAVEAALSAGEYDQAARLIEVLGAMPERHERHGLFTLQRCLERLPEPVLYASPALCFLYANALVFLSVSNQLPLKTLALVEKLLATVEQGWQAAEDVPGLGEVHAFWALLAFRQDEIARSAGLARQSLRSLPASVAYAASRIICLSIIAYDAQERGEFEAARQHYLESLALTEQSSNPGAKRVILLRLGALALARGELHQAAHYFQLEQSLAEEAADIADRETARLGLAEVAYEWNDLPQAERIAREVVAFTQQFPDERTHVSATLLLARILLAQGSIPEAQRLVEALLARPELARAPLIRRKAGAYLVHLQLLLGDVAALRQWVTRPEPAAEALPLLVQGEEALLAARAWMALGEHQESQQILDEWLETAQRLELPRMMVEILLLQCLNDPGNKRSEEATALIKEALPIAHREGYRRLFIDYGQPVLSLLRKVITELDEEHLAVYVRSLLEIFTSGAAGFLPTGDETALRQLLSPQEMRIFRLLEAGFSRAEMAAELTISTNTVKTHLRHIYEKLNVTSRAGAIEVAHRRPRR